MNINFILQKKMIKTNQELLNRKKFQKEEIKKATLIIHPRNPKYNIKIEEIAKIFEEGSNFTTLENPIIDKQGNKFWDSEGYYMAQRIKDDNAKKIIAFLSTGHGLSTKARELFELE